jgi:hypothetical protein
MKNTNPELSTIARILGKAGGEQTKRNHGKDYYRDLGKYAMGKRWKDHRKP